jgi:hypothetical protein
MHIYELNKEFENSHEMGLANEGSIFQNKFNHVLPKLAQKYRNLNLSLFLNIFL